MVSRMSRPANRRDNARCETFIKTLNWDETSADEREHLEHLRDHIQELIGRHLNQKRLPSTLGYRSQ